MILIKTCSYIMVSNKKYCNGLKGAYIYASKFPVHWAYQFLGRLTILSWSYMGFYPINPAILSSSSQLCLIYDER